MTLEETRLRAAMPADAGAIRALTRAAYAKWVPVIGREPKPMAADYEAAVREHRFALLHRGEALVALVETMAREDHLWIENLAVAPEEQGRGYARRLLAHVESEARAMGVPEIRLLTNQAFDVNIPFYERNGFEVTARKPYLNGITVYMRRGL